MRVYSITPTNFQAKQRFIEPKTKDGIKNILTKMDEESIIINKDNAFMLKSLSLEGGSSLSDNRTALSQPTRTALLNVGNKAQLLIDTDTGEILQSRKGFFYTWSGITKSLAKSVDKMLKNFDDVKVVSKHFSTVTN